MAKDNKFNLTRRQFLKGNILLAFALLISRLPLKALKEAFRNKDKPNTSLDKEARFYSNLAG